MQERISDTEDQLSEIKLEGKIRGKRVKRNEQSLQGIWDYLKRPNLCLIRVPECDGENETKLKITLQEFRKHREHRKAISQEEQPQGTKLSDSPGLK